MKCAALILTAIALLLALTGCGGRDANTIVIGGKEFSEQSILGEMLAALIEKNTDLKVERRFYLGGTQVVHQAILRGDIDLYPEYTGTAYQVILKQSGTKNPKQVYEKVKADYAKQFDLVWMQPFGFNNTYAITMRSRDARRLAIKSISDLAALSDKLTAGLDPEFLERPDGWPGLRKAYGLEFSSRPRQLDPGIVYRAVADGKVDVVDTYSTDGRIPAYRLLVLDDDKRFFPPYYAAPVIRKATLEKHPQLRKVLNLLANKIDEPTMRRLNYEADEKGERPKVIARRFLREKGLL